MLAAKIPQCFTTADDTADSFTYPRPLMMSHTVLRAIATGHILTPSRLLLDDFDTAYKMRRQCRALSFSRSMRFSYEAAAIFRRRFVAGVDERPHF